MAQHTIEIFAPTAQELADEDELEVIATRIDFDPALTELIDKVRTAASELEGQGAKSDRIATQLLTALATFHRTVGRP